MTAEIKFFWNKSKSSKFKLSTRRSNTNRCSISKSRCYLRWKTGFDRNTNQTIVQPPAAEPQGTIIYEPVNTYVPPVYVAPTPPTPTVEPVLTSPPPPAIKTAQPDIILFESDLPSSQAMIDLVLEDIGGQELINIARSDTINGQNITYQPIKIYLQFKNKIIQIT